MKGLSDVRGVPLKWVRVGGFRGIYELRAGPDPVAMLRWGRPVVGETAGGTWTLPFEGLDPDTVEISSAGSGLPEAVWEKRTGRTGSMTFVDGQTYRWQGSSWGRRAEWTKLDGSVVVDTHGAEVVVVGMAARPSHLSVLVLTAQYLNSLRLANWVAHVGGVLGHLAGSAGG